MGVAQKNALLPEFGRFLPVSLLFIPSGHIEVRIDVITDFDGLFKIGHRFFPMTMSLIQDAQAII